MNIKSAEFVTSATKPSQYPPVRYPEMAFAGRSNVGKSSLVDALTNDALVQEAPAIVGCQTPPVSDSSGSITNRAHGATAGSEN